MVQLGGLIKKPGLGSLVWDDRNALLFSDRLPLAAAYSQPLALSGGTSHPLIENRRDDGYLSSVRRRRRRWRCGMAISTV